MKNFIKKKENFVCEHCGTKVQGTGYTNHCPKCLYSKHVDLKTPGDRLSSCEGLMKPIGIDDKKKKGDHVIIHRCQKCGKINKNKVSPEDNADEIAKISNTL